MLIPLSTFKTALSLFQIDFLKTIEKPEQRILISLGICREIRAGKLDFYLQPYIKDDKIDIKAVTEDLYMSMKSTDDTFPIAIPFNETTTLRSVIKLEDVKKFFNQTLPAVSQNAGGTFL